MSAALRPVLHENGVRAPVAGGRQQSDGGRRDAAYLAQRTRDLDARGLPLAGASDRTAP